LVAKVQRVMSESVKPETIAKGFAGELCIEGWQQLQLAELLASCCSTWTNVNNGLKCHQ
jgi:hypothetical protein